MTERMTEREIRPGLEFEVPGEGQKKEQQAPKPEIVPEPEKAEGSAAEQTVEAGGSKNVLDEIKGDPEVPSVLKESLEKGLRSGKINPLTAHEGELDVHSLQEALNDLIASNDNETKDLPE